VIKFLVGENVPSAEIHHRLQQQYGEECLRRRHSLTAAAQCGLFTYKSVPVIFEPPRITKHDRHSFIFSGRFWIHILACRPIITTVLCTFSVSSRHKGS